MTGLGTLGRTSRCGAYQELEGVSSPAAYERMYLEEIRHTDAELGRLLDALEQRSPEAGVLITADHGEALGEDGYFFAHGHSVGLDQVRVPLVWRPPGAGPARIASTASRPSFAISSRAVPRREKPAPSPPKPVGA